MQFFFRFSHWQVYFDVNVRWISFTMRQILRKKVVSQGYIICHLNFNNKLSFWILPRTSGFLISVLYATNRYGIETVCVSRATPRIPSTSVCSSMLCGRNIQDILPVTCSSRCPPSDSQVCKTTDTRVLTTPRSSKKYALRVQEEISIGSGWGHELDRVLLSVSERTIAL